MFGVGEVIVLGNDVQPTNNNNFKPNCKELEKTQNFKEKKKRSKPIKVETKKFIEETIAIKLKGK